MSLGAIDPAYLDKTPLDPFTGKPYRVEIRDGQFLVFSIGPNGKDENGDFVPKRWMQGTKDDVGTGAWDANLRGLPPGIVTDRSNPDEFRT